MPTGTASCWSPLAGNGGSCSGKGDSVSYPARYESVVAVAAVDTLNARPCWSSTGSAVELAAPGVSVFSTWPTNLPSSYRDPQPVCELVAEAQTCHLKFGSGTSMSAPHVAGAAALLFASGIADANGANRVGDDVRSRLQQTAVDIGSSGRDPQYGYGLVDVRAALGGEGGTSPPGGTPGGATTISLSLSGYKSRGRMHVDLTWSGAVSETVDVWRDGVKIAAADPNDGAYHDHPPKGGDTHSYRICESGSDSCSNEASITL